MKKRYIKPTLTVVEIKQRPHLLAGSEINNIYSNNSMIYNGGWWGEGRSRELEFDDGEFFEMPTSLTDL